MASIIIFNFKMLKMNPQKITFTISALKMMCSNVLFLLERSKIYRYLGYNDDDKEKKH